MMPAPFKMASFLPQPRCTCQCSQKEETQGITRWFPRIRRRSSSSSSSSSAVSYNRRASADSIHTTELEDRHVNEFIKTYEFAVDEVNYAIESQGSIYYDGDLSTATEAVDTCLDNFRELMQIINRDRSHEIQQKWTDTLFALRARLDDLPPPSSYCIHF